MAVVMKKILFCTLALLMFAFSAAELWAVQIAGVDFRDTENAGAEALGFRGAGILEWLIFDVYVVALYMPSHVPSRDVLHDVPKKLVFHYLSNMKAEQFKESGEPLLARNASYEEIATIRDRIDTINALYRDVSKGERYSLTYVPGKGTELALNGEVLGTIEGYDFASVYFRIWLGTEPVDEKLKENLLNLR